MAIPKIIHFCWLSGEPFPELILKCIESWKKFLPNYEIVLWNREKIKGISSEWVNSAIAQKKWAFAADYIRLYALYEYGGIYLDSDVEVLKSFDELLNEKYFLGRETHHNVIEAAVIGCEPKLDWIKKTLQWYQNREFTVADLNNPEIAVPVILKNVLHDYPAVRIYPSEYFSPKDNRTGSVNITENTYSIHHFNGEWFSPYQREYFRIRVKYSKKCGNIMGFIVATLYSVKIKLIHMFNK